MLSIVRPATERASRSDALPEPASSPKEPVPHFFVRVVDAAASSRPNALLSPTLA
jgi:hypothetical protein